MQSHVQLLPAPRASARRRLTALFACVLLSYAAQAWAVPQCSDGIDNDGDQKTDALVDLSSDQSQQKFANRQPEVVYQLVEDRLRSTGQKSPRDLLGKDDSGMAFVNNAPTATKVCNILGYRTYIAVGTADDEGKTIWFNGGDTMYNWDGARWYRTDDQCRYRNPNHWAWIADITCQGKLAQCQDQVDNDGDGLTDYPADSGCASATDNSEKPHDPDCSNPNDDSEFPDTQCQNTRDDDSDGLTDSQDPGCWTDTTNPQTYNPSLNDESRATSECQDGRDNDGDAKIDYPADRGCTSRQDYSEAGGQYQCANGLDDDSDGLIDCQDPGCWAGADLSTCNPNLDNEGAGTSACQDGRDNDSDGKIDYPNDPGCSSRQDYTEDDPRTACNNGLDDDQDGLIDYGRDPGCASTADTSERDPNGPQCDNGIDDDGDTRVDYPADTGCTGPTDTTEQDVVHVCQNGVDDDVDGYIDLADKGCTSPTDDTECDPGLTQCDNCIDDDHDGRIDMRDPDCTVPWGTSEGCSTPTACNNGLDDDRDGYIDMADKGCTSPADTSERDATMTACDNGVDDDRDGKIDYPDDPGCYAPWDTTENDPAPTTVCSNGLDDDRDGYIDMADKGCTSPLDDSERDSTAPVCDNGIDDDRDGKFDFPDDPDCCAPWGMSEGPSTFVTACSNGLDDDQDGYIDMADGGCKSPADTSERDITAPICDNGIDDDGDGLTDFPADPGCIVPWDTTEQCGVCRASTAYGDLASDNTDFAVNLRAGALALQTEVNDLAMRLAQYPSGKPLSRRVVRSGKQALRAAEAAVDNLIAQPGDAAACQALRDAIERYDAEADNLARLAQVLRRALVRIGALSKAERRTPANADRLERQVTTLSALLRHQSGCE